MVTSVGWNVVRLSWNMSTGDLIQKYILTYNMSSINIDKSSNKHDLTGLMPDTLYQIRLQAVNEIGSSGNVSVSARTGEYFNA